MGGIWLTGGSGMVGQAIQRQGLAMAAPSSRELDLRDAEAVRTYVRRQRPDVVIHAAGRVGGIAANIADPMGFLDDNLRMGLNVVRACLDEGVTRLVNLGSSCMYPRDRELLAEADLLTGKLEPTNEGYALAKICCARACAYASQQHGVAYRTLIPCNLYGPGDHFDGARSHLVAAAIRKVHSAKDGGPVEIWGDGSARREFLYVDDLAMFVMHCIEDVAGLPQELNVGAGTDETVTRWYELVAEAVGYDGGFRYDIDKPVGMKRKLMDSSRAAALGFLASTPPAEGIARTYAWFLEHACGTP